MSTDRQRFLAFTFLIGTIAVVVLASLLGAFITGKTVPETMLALTNNAVSGLVGIAGTAAGLLFRTSQTEATTAQALATAATSGPTGTPADPVSVTETRV